MEKFFKWMLESGVPKESLDNLVVGLFCDKITGGCLYKTTAIGFMLEYICRNNDKSIRLNGVEGSLFEQLEKIIHNMKVEDNKNENVDVKPENIM